MESGDLATWIGVGVAFVVGVGGVVVAAIGLRVARQARAEAGTANELARAALVGDDVTWSLHWGTAGSATLYNNGTDVATNVRGAVTVDGEMQSFGPVAQVDNLGGVRLVFDNVPVALAAEEARKNNGRVENGYVLWEDEHDMNHRVSWRITWDTPLGRTMPTDAQTYINQPILPRSRVPRLEVGGRAEP